MIEEWYKDYNSTVKLLSIPCLKSYRQEPYVMVKKDKTLPKFDERFMGYGKDKISWIETLRYNGYMFSLLKGGFAVDVPHPRWVISF